MSIMCIYAMVAASFFGFGCDDDQKSSIFMGVWYLDAYRTETTKLNIVMSILVLCRLYDRKVPIIIRECSKRYSPFEGRQRVSSNSYCNSYVYLVLKKLFRLKKLYLFWDYGIAKTLKIEVKVSCGTYVDDIILVSRNCMEILNVLQSESYNFKLKGTSNINSVIHLGSSFSRDKDGTLTMNPNHYLKRIGRFIQTTFSRRSNQCKSKISVGSRRSSGAWYKQISRGRQYCNISESHWCFSMGS